MNWESALNSVAGNVKSLAIRGAVGGTIGAGAATAYNEGTDGHISVGKATMFGVGAGMVSKYVNPKSLKKAAAWADKKPNIKASSFTRPADSLSTWINGKTGSRLGYTGLSTMSSSLNGAAIGGVAGGLYGAHSDERSIAGSAFVGALAGGVAGGGYRYVKAFRSIRAARNKTTKLLTSGPIGPYREPSPAAWESVSPRWTSNKGFYPKGHGLPIGHSYWR